MPWDRFREFAAAIAALPDVSREALTADVFRLGGEGPLSVYYAPFDHINESARLALVGITPGWQQMREAHRLARDALRAGTTEAEASAQAKAAASFSGAMRSNLVTMLDGIGLAEALPIKTTAELFGARSDLLHPTSAIRYPVLVGSHAGNYGGSSPGILESPLLRRYVYEELAPELDVVPGALVVPLGVAVTDALDALAGDGLIDEGRVLAGFPHPSGMNASRLRAYERNRGALARQVTAWYRQAVTSSPVAPPRRPQHTAPSRLPTETRPRDDANAQRARSSQPLPSEPLPDPAWFAELALRSIRALGGEITDRRTYYRKGIDLGGFTPQQRAIPPPPRNTANLNSKIEFELSFALSKLKKQGRLEHPARNVWRIKR